MAKSGALQRWKDKCFSDFDFCMRKAPFKLVTAAKGQFGLCTMSMGDWPIQQALHREPPAGLLVLNLFRVDRLDVSPKVLIEPVGRGIVEIVAKVGADQDEGLRAAPERLEQRVGLLR